MKIEKAIEILDMHTKDLNSIYFDDIKKAQALGIEALEYVQMIRKFPHLIDHIQLPPEN